MKKSSPPTALITGATSPIGRAIALKLAGCGTQIVAHYWRSREEAEQLCAELKKLGIKAWPVKANFNKVGEAELLAKRAANLAGNVDIVVNNASVFNQGTIDKISREDLLENMTVNAWAPLALVQALCKTRTLACVVNILDTRTSGGDPGHAGYILSKKALAEMTRMCAAAFAPQIRVNGVAPGLVLTRPADRRKYRALASSLPLKRYCLPGDVADAVLFLIKSRVITGQVIYVDAGRHVRK